jgi:hypothetical protein
MSRSTRRVRLLTLSGRPNPKGLASSHSVAVVRRRASHAAALTALGDAWVDVTDARWRKLLVASLGATDAPYEHSFGGLGRCDQASCSRAPALVVRSEVHADLAVPPRLLADPLLSVGPC